MSSLRIHNALVRGPIPAPPLDVAVKPKVGEQPRTRALDSPPKIACDGPLTAEAQAKLERGGRFATVFAGRDAPISERSTQEARAVVMALSGAIKTMNAVSKRGELSERELDRVGRQLEHARQQHTALLSGGTLGAVSPEVVDQLRARFGELEHALAGLMEATSKLREKLIPAADGTFDPTRFRELIATAGHARGTLASMRNMARVLSASLVSKEPARETLMGRMSTLVGDGAIGVGARLYDRLAMDAASGMLNREDVTRLAGRIQAISHEHQLPAETIAQGIHDLISAHFLSTRDGNVPRRKELVTTNGEVFMALAATAAKQSGGDVAKFEATLAPFIDDVPRFEAFLDEYAKKPVSAFPSTPRVASDAVMDASHGLDVAFGALFKGDFDKLERVLPELKSWVEVARAGVGQAVLGSGPAEQHDVTRLQIVCEELERGSKLGAWGTVLSDVLRAESTDGAIAKRLVLPPSIALELWTDPQLLARLDVHLAPMVEDLRATLKLSERVRQLRVV